MRIHHLSSIVLCVSCPASMGSVRIQRGCGRDSCVGGASGIYLE